MKNEIVTASWITSEIDRISESAARLTKCLRKGVGSGLYNLHDGQNQCLVETYNGPSRFGFSCSNMVGACGCIHSEPRTLIRGLLNGYRSNLVMFCTYSPCVTCANLIIESRIVVGLVRNIFTKYPVTGKPEHDERGEQFLKEAGIDILTYEQLSNFKGKEGVESDTLRRWKLARPNC